MTTQTAPRLLRASEAAAMLGISVDHLRNLVAEEQLRSVRLGGTGWHRFRVEDVEALIAGEEPDS